MVSKQCSMREWRTCAECEFSLSNRQMYGAWQLDEIERKLAAIKLRTINNSVRVRSFVCSVGQRLPVRSGSVSALQRTEIIVEHSALYWRLESSIAEAVMPYKSS